MAYIYERNERIYIIGDVDGSSNPIFAATAQATPANANYVCVVGSSPQWGNALLTNPCKTGSLSQLAGVRGRGTASLSLTLPVQGSGVAGTAPDGAPLISAWFGAKPTISAGVSVTWALSDVVGSCTVYSFWSPATASHQCAFGWIPDELVFQTSAEIATYTASGPCVWIQDSSDFSGMTTEEKGGLASFASGTSGLEPTTPVSNGTPVAGFIGAITVNGVSTFKLTSWTLRIRKGVVLGNAYNSYVATIPAQNRREISFDFQVADEDSAVAAIAALKTKLRAKTSFSAVLVQGVTAGNIWTHTINGFQSGGYNYVFNESRREFSVSGLAHASSATAKDEYGLVLT